MKQVALARWTPRHPKTSIVVLATAGLVMIAFSARITADFFPAEIDVYPALDPVKFYGALALFIAGACSCRSAVVWSVVRLLCRRVSVDDVRL
jgi:hypothetical protein